MFIREQYNFVFPMLFKKTIITLKKLFSITLKRRKTYNVVKYLGLTQFYTKK